METDEQYTNMTLRSLLGSIAAKYDRSLGTGSEAHGLLRNASWPVISAVIPEGYLIEGSGGRGAAALVPWIGVFHPTETTSAQRGIYVVYLFKSDMSEVYLSLNQGVTDLIEEFGPTIGKQKLREQAVEIRGKMSDKLGGYLAEIDLGSTAPLPRNYEIGNIAAVRYEIAGLPPNEVLVQDLNDFLHLYAEALEARGPRPLFDNPEKLEESLNFLRDKLNLSNPPADDGIELLMRETFWSREALEDLIETLQHRRPQVILAGPPGTGKTWVAECVGTYLADGDRDAVHVVQFHPSYAYEDFVEGLRPSSENGQVVFNVLAGKLIEVADLAREDDHNVVLIIDEMNRANLPSVFGELLYLLEYRDKSLDLLHRRDFSLPSNLLIIGTMNTVDRSIRSVDAALRRRFDIFDCPPQPEILNAYYARDDRKSDISGLSAGLEKLNNKLSEHLDRHHKIGHSFFMNSHLTRREFKRTWDRQIQPLIEEYFFDQPSLVADFTPDAFWPGNSLL